MAFVTRAVRKGGIDTNGTTGWTTAETVGPGSYSWAEGNEFDQGYAPFSSTADRGLAEGAAGVSAKFTPGPGAYGEEAHEGKHAISSNVFLSKVSRFAVDKSTSKQAPGPGTYVDENKWVKSSHRYPSETALRRVTFQRVPGAPSVPAKNQSYGYEEAETGELVMQQPPDVGHTGFGVDTVGPAGYNPDFSTMSSKRHTNFSRSRTSRRIFSDTITPGPGAYGTEKVGEVAPGKLRVNPPPASSNFSSRVPRQHQIQADEDTAVPGPGFYAHRDQFARRDVSEAHQFFGSSSRRAYEVDVPSLLSAPTPAKTPGPGAYDERRTAFVRRGDLGAEAAPFASTDFRFKMSKARAAMPGPGAYDESNDLGFIADMEKRVVSRSGVFGSTTQRFANQKSSQSYLYLRSFDSPEARLKYDTRNTPGPGSYQEREAAQFGGEAGTGKRRGLKSSMFKSSSDRFNQTAPADPSKPRRAARPAYPPPGAYEPLDPWARTKPRGNGRSEFFISSAPRFPKSDAGVGLKVSNIPGPGTYDSTAGPKGPLPNRTCFNSTSRRFHGNSTGAPGPGSYDIEDTGRSMVKRSFNVTIDGVTF